MSDEPDVLSRLGLQSRAYGLVTLHRPATVDDPFVLLPIRQGARDRRRRLSSCVSGPSSDRQTLTRLAHQPGDRVMPPLSYLDFLALQAEARLVLTDSGGVQEETTVLGVPCLTLRDTTERPVTVSGHEHCGRTGTGTHRVRGAARARPWCPGAAACSVGRPSRRQDRRRADGKDRLRSGPAPEQAPSQSLSPVELRRHTFEERREGPERAIVRFGKEDDLASEAHLEVGDT